MKIIKAWGSHLPILMKLVSITDGDILELGTGLYSTPYLHWACFPTRRTLVSYDNNLSYIRYMNQYLEPFHQIIAVENWDDINIEKPWDIAFIDHAPDFRRKEEAKRLANCAKYVVIHDSDPTSGGKRAYKYDEIYPFFKYRYDYTETSPNTTVLSNFVDLTNFKI
jgi:hypothetical protein